MSASLRVLQIHPPVGHGVDVYRVHNLAEQIDQAGHHSEVLTLAELAETGSPGSLVTGRDLLILHRVPWDVRIEALVDAARSAGVTSVFEADDLVFVPGAERWVDGVRRLPAHEMGLYAEGLERYAASYRNCDAFLASTPFLAGMRPFGPKSSQVVRNVLGGQQLAAAARIRRERGEARGGERVIGFGAGTATHDRDMREVVPALRDLLSRRSDLRVEIVGPVDLGSSFAGFEDRVIQREARPWEQWWELLAGFDVALAPLERRNPYCRAKSALKFLEAAILDVPIVASRIDDYVHEIEDGRTGFLADSPETWSDAIESLLDDDELRGSIVTAARKHVETRCTVEARAADTARQLEALRDGESRSPASSERLLDLAWLIPSPFPGSGGHANIFGVARSLERRGHRNSFSVDTSQLQAHDGDGIRDFVDRNFGETGVSFRPGWDLSGEHADLAVATSWATAETVASSAVDAKAYFVQDFENLFFAPGEDAIRAERTYHLGLSCVTLGEWLTAELRSRYGADSTAFPFPVTVEEPGGDLSSGSRDGGPRLLFFAQPDKPRRGYRLGLEALAIFHEACPEVKIAFFGSKDVDRESVPVPFEDHGILSESQLEELYRGADAGFVISMTNPTLVSANMMRCGCVPVDLDLPNNRFEYRSEEDSLLAEPTAAGIAEALRRLFTDRKLLERLRAAGPISVEGRSLETCVDAIEAAFVRKLLTGETAERPFQLEVFQGEPTTWVSLADGPVAQAIRGRTDGLTRISLMLGTFDQLPGALDVELVDSRTGEIVVQQCMVGEGVRNNDWNHVDFEPIADSGGRDFDLRLRMSEADAAPVAVYLSGAGARLDAAARSGDSALAAPICFETYVRPIGAAPAVPIARQSEPAHRRAASTPVAAGELSEQAAHIVELIWTRGAQERELRSVLEERTAALEHGTAGLTAFLNGIEGRITRPPFDRLLRLVGLAPPRETYHEPMRFVTVDLRGDVVVAQRFVAERDGLDRLMVRVATEGRRLQAPLVLRLREGGLRGPVVREVEIPPSQVYDNQHCTAVFEALADSAGQIYCFELSSPSALRGCAPRIWGHRSRDGSGQRRYHRGARAGGRLDFLQGFGSILGG